MRRDYKEHDKQSLLAKRDSQRLLALRDRILERWRVAKRAESKERIALALDTFIEELIGSTSVSIPKNYPPDSHTPSEQS